MPFLTSPGDLSGSSDFFDVRNEFHRNAQGTLLVYDVTNLASFQSLSSWLGEHAKFGGKPAIVVVCANKTDEAKRVVTEAEGKKWAQAQGFVYFETSAKSGQNVNELFAALFKGISAAGK